MQYVIKELLDSKSFGELKPYLEKVGLNWYDSDDDEIDNPFVKYDDISVIRLVIDSENYDMSYTVNRCPSYIKRILTMTNDGYDIKFIKVEELKELINNGTITNKNKIKLI